MHAIKPLDTYLMGRTGAKNRVNHIVGNLFKRVSRKKCKVQFKQL